MLGVYLAVVHKVVILQLLQHTRHGRTDLAPHFDLLP